MRRLWRYLVEGRNYILVMVVLLAATYIVMHWVVSAVGPQAKPVLVVVKKGESAAEVGASLHDKGLIRYSWLFPLMANLTGDSQNIKAGAYRLDGRLSVRQILERLIRGEVAAVWITVPEGFTARQIAERLAARRLVDKQEFLVLVESGGKDFSKILYMYAPDLEGYLFPSTYLVPLNSQPREVVAMMLDAFKQKVAGPYSEDIDKIAADTSLESRAAAMHRVVTVASLIEREARVPKDRPLVSAVIWNRLRIGMKLDIDATVQYALGQHRSRLYYRDLEINSPYNTYINPGLPPGPIANPGLDSIKAALHPANVDYLYYVAKPDGSHVFTRTLQEHDAAVRRIRSGSR